MEFFRWLLRIVLGTLVVLFLVHCGFKGIQSFIVAIGAVLVVIAAWRDIFRPW